MADQLMARCAREHILQIVSMELSPGRPIRTLNAGPSQLADDARIEAAGCGIRR